MEDFMLYGQEEAELEQKLEYNSKLKPNTFFMFNEGKFGGSIVTVEKVQNEDLIFITPKGKRIRAFKEFRKPTCKRDCQVFAGMISSLSKWNPTISFEIPLIRKSTASKSKFVWTDDMEKEYVTVRKTMIEQICLTPYNPDKTLRLILDETRLCALPVDR